MGSLDRRDRLDASTTEGGTLPEVTMQMIRAGLMALREFDPDKEEDAALVASVYWAMDAARPRA